MFKQLVVAALAAFVSAGTALAAQGAPPSPVPAFRVASELSLKPAGQKIRQAPAVAQRRNVSLKLPAAPLPSLGGYRSQFDAKEGATRFLWADTTAPAALLAPLKAELMAEYAGRDYLGQQSGRLNIDRQSLKDARLVDLHDSGKGPIIARYQQVQDGIEVFGKRVNVMMDRGMKLVASSGNFASRGAASGNSMAAKARAAEAFRIPPEQALAIAYADLSGEPLATSAFAFQRSAGEYRVYAGRTPFGEMRLTGEQRSRKFWYPLDGELVPAWYAEVNAHSQDGADSYAVAYLISARDGRVLFRKSLIEYENYSYRVYADDSGVFQPFDGPLGNGYAPFVGTPGDGLVPRVAVPSRLVTLQNGPISTNDPWLPPGALETTGNNVDAYLDLFGTALADGTVTSGQGFDPGTTDERAPITGANSFDYPYTPDADPSTGDQRRFAVVTLFYLNNWLHDWWYDNGFDEAAGNAQSDNFGRGGVEGDPLLVEVQDFSGRNNANMSTPPDGGSPRMQQYLFDGLQQGALDVTPSAGAAYTLAFNTAAFGAKNFDVTAEVVQVLDAAGVIAPAAGDTSTNGCTTPFTNAADIAGKIALIDRGSCGFAVKAKNAQDAGAVGVIIANNAAGPPPGMGGADPAITIGTLSVSQSDGARIVADLGLGAVTARLQLSTAADVDSALDAQIVAHEWFHYASNRLVGDGFGLSNQQGRAMGEGWSDFSALLLTARPEDRTVVGNENFQGAYPAAFYSTSDAYFGIRRAPYSTDFAIFPLTFRHIEDGEPLPTTAPFAPNGLPNSQVHNSGTIWANTLWEIYVSLLNDPRYSFAQAQDRMKSYLIAGLKMTPNAPTMLEARDGLLAAAFVTDEADFELMAAAFAKRGMGVGAVAPDRDDATHGGVVESFLAQAGGFEVVDASLDFGYFNGAEGFIDDDGELDPGETALLSVTLRSTGTNALTQPIVAQLSSDGDTDFGNGGNLSFPASAAAPVEYGDTVSGSITVKLNSSSVTAEVLTLTLEFPDAGASPDEVIEAGPVQLQLTVNYDIAPGQRASDDIESPIAAAKDWETSLTGTGDGWSVVDGEPAPFLFASGLLWFAPNNSSFADIRLTTPPLVVGDEEFAINFEHYFQFEFAGVFDGTPVGYDGGILEISSDGGATWTDVADAGGVFTTGNGYNGVFLAMAPDGTPTPDDTGEHIGFVGDNFAANGGFLEPVTLSFGTALAGQTVQLRFRQVSDAAVGDFGWAVDNVSFTGITNLPFSNVVDEDGVPDNQAPDADAGADSLVLVNSPATLDGSGSSDPDGDALTFAWTQTSGPATATLMGAGSQTASVTTATAGTYVFTLTVTDIREVSDTDTVTVVVHRPPVANAGADAAVSLGNTVTLNGSGSSDPDGDEITYAWTRTSGPAVTLSGAAGPSPSFVPSAVGTYVFELRVTDSRGAVATDSVTVVATVVIPTTSEGGSPGLWLLPMLGLAALWRRRRR